MIIFQGDWLANENGTTALLLVLFIVRQHDRLRQPKSDSGQP